MKFCTSVQNFADELGRACYEAMSIPSARRIANNAGLSNLHFAT